MKKILVLMVIFLLVGCENKISDIEKYDIPKTLNISENVASVTEYYIFGTHLNITGELQIEEEKNYDNVKLVVYYDNETEYSLITETKENKLLFRISDTKNGGIYLDSFESGKYIFLLKVGENEYYKLQNDTDYKDIEYTTITKENKNKRIIFSSDNIYQGFGFKVNDTVSTDYDITIDAGHGGKDPGASYNGHSETDFTLMLAKKLKEKLEANGLKIKLTRNDDTLDKYTLLPTYGKGGRVTTINESGCKYAFSFHLNSGYSNDLNGVEIYTANNIDYTFARSIAHHIVDSAKTKFSDNYHFKVEPGVYTRTFRQSEIDSFAKELRDLNINPYNITNNTVYYYFIRETGGYMNGAYIDGREGNDTINNFVKANIGRESYIMEIGYITHSKDVDNIQNNADKYVDGITTAIMENIYR